MLYTVYNIPRAFLRLPQRRDGIKFCDDKFGKNKWQVLFAICFPFKNRILSGNT